MGEGLLQQGSPVLSLHIICLWSKKYLNMFLNILVSIKVSGLKVLKVTVITRHYQKEIHTCRRSLVNMIWSSPEMDCFVIDNCIFGKLLLHALNLCLSCKQSYFAGEQHFILKSTMFNRPGVAGAVLRTPP